MFTIVFVNQETEQTHRLSYQVKTEAHAVYSWQEDMRERNLQTAAIFISVYKN